MIYRLINADVMDGLRMLGDERVDAIVCDPPYEFGFMGKAWDSTGVSYSVPMWRECLRVLKPGGHLVAFGGSRTYHRLACAIEDAGFEIRDQLQWLYGSGFPKSLDVSKAIDKAQRRDFVRAAIALGVQIPGNSLHDWTKAEHAPGDAWWNKFKAAIPEVEWMRIERAVVMHRSGLTTTYDVSSERPRTLRLPVTAPATDVAAQWRGWGTALKPAHEPIVLARKPFRGTVAANVLAHGTGAMNIDGCRIESEPRAPITGRGAMPCRHDESTPRSAGTVAQPHDAGRWPANVLLDEEAAAILDEQSGELTSGTKLATHARNVAKIGGGPVYSGGLMGGPEADIIGSSGGASRFFYTSKSSRSEREEGMELMPESDFGRWSNGDASPGTFQSPKTNRKARNHHPTVKPVDLMRWLVRLVTPPGGTVLDPFLGSGSTGMAAIAESFNFIGIEKEAEYVEIARRRIGSVAPLLAREESQLDERVGV